MHYFNKILTVLLQICLWVTFVLAVNDPGVLGQRQATNPYAVYASFIDGFYAFTQVIIDPVIWVFQRLSLYSPNSPDTWFPLLSAPELHVTATSLGIGNFISADLYAGALILWVPIASAAVYLLYIIIGMVIEPIRNWCWNMVIEYVFQRNKTRLYAKALEEKEADLARVNSQYRMLAQETHSLKDSVITDELTQVFNKRFFLHQLRQEFDICKHDKAFLSLIMIDIDYFKKLNDSYGHVAGDEVLKAVAKVLKRFSPEHCYPCRYGGEEFAIIMPKKSYEEAVEAARLLQENIQLLKFETIDPRPTPSIMA